MKPSQNFDFRTILETGAPANVNAEDVERLVVGAALCNKGLALVALREGELKGASLKAFAHVVIGPIEDDWEHIATLIDQLRNILEPPKVSHVLLRVEKGHEQGICERISQRLHSVFPDEITTVQGGIVADWTEHSNFEIGSPDIPEDDIWTRELLISAAQTAVFLEHGALSLGLPDPTGKVEGELDSNLHEVGVESRATVCAEQKSSASPKLWNSPSATAVNFTSPVLHIATIRQDVDDSYFLDEERTLSFELSDRSASGLANLQGVLKELFRNWDIRSVSMRVGDKKGPYQLNPNAYKIEAALQLLETIDLVELTVAQVAGFARRNNHLLPKPQEHLKQQALRAGQLHAIRAAALALHRIEQGG